MSRFTVNGQPVHYRLDPQTPLLWALRDASNLTGSKFGCGTGHCGACTVHVDGRAVRSCRIPIGEIEGSFVVTIEGLSASRSHPIQQAFAAGNVSQCGYCIPGMLMAGAKLLEEQAQPDLDQIQVALSGNICRCTGYRKILEAVLDAAREHSEFRTQNAE